jgi:hypothetical protein
MYARIDSSNSIIKYPYTETDLRNENPNTSFSADTLSNIGIVSDVVSVQPIDRPTKPGWHTIEKSPVMDGDVWKQSWELKVKDVGELRSDEITAVPSPFQEGYVAHEGTPELDGDVWKQTWNQVENDWHMNRVISYGDWEAQIEFITENGLEAWQSKVAEIKSKYPKS